MAVMTIDEKFAEIRAEYAAMFDGEPARWMVRDLLAMLDATREDVRAIIAAAYPAQPDATPTARELCEHIGALHDAVASAEKRAEDAEGWEDAWERDCEAVASALGFAPGEWVSTGLARSVTDLRARAEDAERKLAALHAQVHEVVRHRDAVPALEDAERRAREPRGGCPDEGWGDDAPPSWQAWRDARQRLDEAKRSILAGVAAFSLDDTAPVAERHDRDVRVRELRRLADGVEQTITGAFIRTWLRDEAGRIERGEA